MGIILTGLSRIQLGGLRGEIYRVKTHKEFPVVACEDSDRRKRTYKVVGDAEVVKSDDEIEEVFDFNSFSDDGMRRRMVRLIAIAMRDGGS
jgi:hypothetical protein